MLQKKYLDSVIPAQAGIQIVDKALQSRATGFVRFAAYLSLWISACAGMTNL
jgi:hypothetical protein